MINGRQLTGRTKYRGLTVEILRYEMIIFNYELRIRNCDYIFFSMNFKQANNDNTFFSFFLIICWAMSMSYG